MSAPLCVVCTRPTADGYACMACGVDRPRAQLAEIADMTPAARDVAHRANRRAGGGGSGKPGSSLPLDLGATARLDAVHAVVAGWARHIGETRGVPQPWVRPAGAPAIDPIVTLARWLDGHLEWMRHRQEADEFLRDVGECARIVRGLARGPAEQKYLGPCGALLLIEGVEGPWPCEGDVYGIRGASRARCRDCGAEVAQEDREAWLDGEVRSHAFRAVHIADAYGVNVNTIRTWHARGLLTAHGEDRDGRPLFNVGEVLDMFRDLAVRRAEGQAKRARRAAELVAGGERMSA
jgi:hypothetical protein